MMIEIINERVAVISTTHSTTFKLLPIKMKWRGRLFIFKEIGFYHPVRQGRTLLHIFEVTDGDLAFRLQLNTESLIWILEKISDGTAN